MKRSISLRARLSILTSLLLTLTCVVVTLFSIYTAESTLSAAVATIPAGEESLPAAEIEPSIAAAVVPTEVLQAELVQAHTRHFSESSLWFMGGVILCGSLVMYLVSGLVLRPLKKLSKTIAAVDPRDLSPRIEGYRAGDELQVLAESFNGMMERLHRAFDRERRFSAAAAHELKTPLTVMKTSVEVLDDTADAEDCRRALQVVKKQADRMTALVGQLLALSSMAQESLAEAVPVGALVSAVIQEYGCGTAIPQLTDCTVTGDALLLRQAVANLVQNALKYGDGTVEARVEAETDWVSIHIGDKGKGILPEEREKIFEPFYRGDKSRSRALGGSGLGLSLTAEIARLHGGSVSCQCPEEGGTVFTLRLPRKVNYGLNPNSL